MKRNGKAYSIDFRESVLAAMDREPLTHKEAAEFFKIGEATVDRWSSLRRETGSVAPRPRGGNRPRAVNARGDQELKRLVSEKPDRTLAELTALLRNRTRSTASRSSVGRAIARAGLTRKKRASAR
jgi:transposase